MELGSPTFVPVRDPEMGFEKIVRIAHACGGNYTFSILLDILANINILVLKSSHSM